MADGRSFMAAFEISATVKAYFALKMIGDIPEAPHMRRAREAILARGGAAKTKSSPASCLRSLVRFRGATSPQCRSRSSFCRAGFRSISKNVLLGAHGDRAAAGAAGAEAAGAQSARHTCSPNYSRAARCARVAGRASGVGGVILRCARLVLKRVEPFSGALRAAPSRAAVAFVTESLNGEDGLGAIYPAMANSVMMYRRAGLSAQSSRPPHRAQIDRKAARVGRRSLLPALRLAGVGYGAGGPCADGDARRSRREPVARTRLAEGAAGAGCEGRLGRTKPGCATGRLGVPVRNAYYPDLDDTAVVVMAMDRAGKRRPTAPYDAAIARAREWIEGLQSRMAAGAPSTPTMSIITSTIFPSRIMARCSTRRPQT